MHIACLEDTLTFFLKDDSEWFSLAFSTFKSKLRCLCLIGDKT